MNWPSVENMNLTDHQKMIAKNSLQGDVCILGGSPGCGKTWLVSELVKCLAGTIGIQNILVAGPTGKSAVRITENLQAKSIDLRARTWHSFLMQLEREAKPFFDQSIIIGDESSMVDTSMMRNIMRARAVNAKLLLVGDVHQLPPVGTGAPLRDLIAAGVAYGELTEIMRNSGGIVETCAAIRDQKKWSGGDNLQLVETKDGHLQEIEWLLNDAKTTLNDERTRTMDPVWDVQIVTAVNEKSQLGRIELNKKLQAFLNKQPGIEGVPFRVGDKLVNTKNATFKSLSLDDFDGELAEEHYVANGELAKVISVSKSELILELEAPKRRIVAPLYSEGNTWELGYALSVHKSQGSDWPWVIVVIDDYPGAKMVCDRAWLYTAISRAKSKCFIVGEKRIADRMCRVSKIWHRKTFLKELILSGRARRSLANV